MTREEQLDWLYRLKSKIPVYLLVEWGIPMGNALDMAIKALDQEPRWIPVSERLPEEGQWVLATFGSKIAVCIAHDNDGTLREDTPLVLENATEFWLYPEPEWGDGYAAWMPLPEPYKGKEEEE